MFDFALRDIEDLQKVRSRITTRLMPEKVFREKQEHMHGTQNEIVYEKLCDLYAVFVVDITTMDQDGYAAAYITKALMEKWNIDKDQLVQIAKTNDVGGVCVENLSDILRFAGYEEDSPLYMVSRIKRERDMFTGDVFTFSEGSEFGGAGVLFNTEEVSKRIKQVIGKGTYWVLPSSIHEVLVLKTDTEFSEENGQVNMLKTLVSSINQDVVDETERLSDSVYLLDTEKETLELL